MLEAEDTRQNGDHFACFMPEKMFDQVRHIGRRGRYGLCLRWSHEKN